MRFRNGIINYCPLVQTSSSIYPKIYNYYTLSFPNLSIHPSPSILHTDQLPLSKNSHDYHFFNASTLHPLYHPSPKPSFSNKILLPSISFPQHQQTTSISKPLFIMDGRHLTHCTTRKTQLQHLVVSQLHPPAQHPSNQHTTPSVSSLPCRLPRRTPAGATTISHQGPILSRL